MKSRRLDLSGDGIETDFDTDVSYSAPASRAAGKQLYATRTTPRAARSSRLPKHFDAPFLSGRVLRPKTKKTADQTLWRRATQQSSRQRSISAYTTLPGQKTHTKYAMRDDTNNTRPACSSGL